MAAVMVRVLVVAPLMRPPFDRGVPSFSQRKLNGALPLGVTVKLALLPVRMVRLAGRFMVPEPGESPWKAISDMLPPLPPWVC